MNVRKKLECTFSASLSNQAYPRVDQLKGASLGQASALLTNIILDCKGLPVTNTLPYYKHS
jgi:hypothetical protein